MPELLDTFATGTPGNTIGASGRTSDSGHTWTRHPNFSFDHILTDAQRARSNGSTMSYASWTPASVEYSVYGRIRVLSLLAGSECGVAGRIDAAANPVSAYIGQYNVSNQRWELIKRESGAVSSLASSAVEVLTAGQDYDIKLEILNASKKLYLWDGSNWVLKASNTTDNTITAAGAAGLRGAANPGNAAGLHIDTVSSAPFGAAAAPPVNTLWLSTGIGTPSERWVERVVQVGNGGRAGGGSTTWI